MTNPNTAHITLVCDRSGSMANIRNDAQGGVNAFIEDQKALGKPCTFHLVDFDAEYLDWYRTVYKGSLSEAPSYVLEPRGGTALFDAVGRAINETGALLRALPEAERPGLVFFVIQTDGEENSSKQFTLQAIKNMITLQEQMYNWTFVFLGMGPDAFAAGTTWGINRIAFVAGNSGVAAASAYSATSQSISTARSKGSNVGVAYASNVAADGTVTVDDNEDTSV